MQEEGSFAGSNPMAAVREACAKLPPPPPPQQQQQQQQQQLSQAAPDPQEEGSGSGAETAPEAAAEAEVAKTRELTISSDGGRDSSGWL